MGQPIAAACTRNWCDRPVTGSKAIRVRPGGSRASTIQRVERRLAVHRVDPLPWTVGPVGGQRQVDLAGVSARRAVDQGLVALVHVALGEGDAQAALQRPAAREEQQARGGHVQPVHDQRIGPAGLHARQAQSCLSAPRPGTDSSPAGLFTTTRPVSACTIQPSKLRYTVRLLQARSSAG
jgi:hypothetical protein